MQRVWTTPDTWQSLDGSNWQYGDVKLSVKSKPNTRFSIDLNSLSLGKTGPLNTEGGRVIVPKQRMWWQGCCCQKLVERVSHWVQPWWDTCASYGKNIWDTEKWVMLTNKAIKEEEGNGLYSHGNSSSVGYIGEEGGDNWTESFVPK